MTNKKPENKPGDDKNWAGKGFGKRNPESAPEPKGKPKDDDEELVWK